MRRALIVLTTAAFAAAGGFARADAVFSESDFNPGSWTDGGLFQVSPPQAGDAAAVVSSRFSGGNPVNNFMLQQFTFSSTDGTWGARAPIWINSFVYDPSTEGAIESISGSVRNIQAAIGQPPHRATLRLFALQGGETYMLSTVLSGDDGDMNMPETNNIFSGVTTDLFARLLPGGGAEIFSEPDFSSNGSAITFGFGWQISQDLAPPSPIDGQIFMGGFDDVHLHITTVPAPGAVALGLVGVTAVSRRRRG
jgi:hypothetical protein